MGQDHTDSELGSVSRWIIELRSLQLPVRNEAARRIVERYFTELQMLVRANLNDRIRQREGASDILQNAFASFFQRQYELTDRKSLRALLIDIVLKKTASAANWNERQKRNYHREQAVGEKGSGSGASPHEVIEQTGNTLRKREPIKRKYRRTLNSGDRSNDSFFDDGAIHLMAYGADPEQAAMAIEMIEQLPDDLQQIAILELQGYSDEEIGKKVGRYKKYVQRQLERIKRRWETTIDGSTPA